MWYTNRNMWNTNKNMWYTVEIHKIVTKKRRGRMGAHSTYRILHPTHKHCNSIRICTNYLILSTFCNNIVDLNWVLQEIYPFLLAISIFAGNNITVCFKDDQIYFNWDHPAFQAKIYFVLYFCMVLVLRFHF